MRPSLPPNYHPSDDEEFMNPLQVEYFRQKLLSWRAELLAESSDTLQHLKEESLLKPDLTDRASLETERAIELRTRARERRLISKIDAALNRIDDGTYGYCEETEEPIGIHRLEARPIATLSIEAQKRHQRMEGTHRDDCHLPTRASLANPMGIKQAIGLSPRRSAQEDFSSEY